MIRKVRMHKKRRMHMMRIRSVAAFAVAGCVAWNAFAANETITVTNVEEFATALLHMNTNCKVKGSSAVKKDTIVLKRGNYDVTDLNLQFYNSSSSVSAWADSGANFGISYFKIKGETDNPRDVVIYRRDPAAKSIMYNYAGVVENLTFSNAVSTANSSYPLRNVNANAKYVNVIVTCCVAAQDGGASKSGTWIDCQFISNRAARAGGALYNGSKAYGCLFENNYAATRGGAAHSSTFSNCVVRCNTAGVSGGGLGDSCSATGCVMYCNVAMAQAGGGAYASELYDCVLSNNVAHTTGGGAYNSVLTNCVVWGNHAEDTGGGLGSNCTATNCLIACNVATNSGGGAYSSVICGGVVSNNTAYVSGGGGCSDAKVYGARICMNRAMGQGADDRYSQGGGLRNCVATDCEIDGNAVFKGSMLNAQGGGAYGTPLTNCFVHCNFSSTLGGGICAGSAFGCVISNNISESTAAAGNMRTVDYIENCDIYEGAIDMQGTLVNCRLMNYTNGNYIAEGANVHTNGWINGSGSVVKSWCVMTNCLVAGNVVEALVVATDGKGKHTRLNNCTIADNRFTNFTSGFTGEKGVLSMVNTAIVRNRNKAGTQTLNVNCTYDYVSMTNCVIGSLNRGENFAYPMVNVTTNNSPRFVDDGSRDSYSPRWNSPLRNIGLVQDWMDGATDIRGDAAYPRLRDGAVDIGCYQCWLDPIGTKLTIR